MAASDVYSALESYITPSGIDLWAAANGSPALTELVPVLTLFGIDSSYVLPSPVLTQTETTVTLTSPGSFGQPGSTNLYPVDATLLYSDSALFSLSLNVVEGTVWTFPGFFTTLPPSKRVSADDPAGSGAAWTTSYLTGSVPEFAVVVQSPVFFGQNGVDQQLQFQGYLPEFQDPTISSLLWMITSWPLPLSGTMQMPASTGDFPVMELIATSNVQDSITAAQDPNAGKGPGTLVLNPLTLTLATLQVDEETYGVSGSSILNFNGAFNVGGGLAGTISTPLLTVGTNWAFSVVFDPSTASLTQGFGSLCRIFGVVLPIPTDFPVLRDFYFAELDVNLQIGTVEGNSIPTFSLTGFALTIQSSQVWVPPVPFVSFSDVGVRWVWGPTVALDSTTGESYDTYLLTGSIFGNILFGATSSTAALPSPDLTDASSDTSVTVGVALSIPSFYINGAMKGGDYIPIGDAFTYYFGGAGPTVPADMNVTALSFWADPIGQQYQAQTEISFGPPDAPSPDQAWELFSIGTVAVSLEQLQMWVQAGGGGVAGGITGVFYLLGAGQDAYTNPQFQLSAEYPQYSNSESGGGWQFAGSLYPGTSIDLTTMVARFVMGDPDYVVPSYVPDLSIDLLDGTFNSATTDYTFSGSASARWNPTLFGTDLMVNASASVAIAGNTENPGAIGTLAGSFSVNKISVAVAMDIGVSEPTYRLHVLFGELWVEGTTAWTGTGSSRHQVVAIQLGGITLGDMLAYLASLAAPTLGFHLDPPWDVLKSVDLSRFVLTLDPELNEVSFVFNASVDLVVMRLDTVGARYIGGVGQGKVELILTGEFFGQAYDENHPLSWDVIDGDPPNVPGQGATAANLRFLGIGQRVALSGNTPDTVAATLSALEAAMQPPVRGQMPLSNSLTYAPSSQWLLGLDIGLIDTVDLGIVFNDPQLYGMSVALKGEKSGSLAGLSFEVLYKRITNNTGVFRAEVTVPDAYRTFFLGPVSLTLGVVVVEVYTNGGFRVDLGFPSGGDYSRSFSVQAGLFIGRGGFYFGLLDGDTSSSVPQIVNGNFSPVLELGVGLTLGMGREIEVGILSGGAYVEAEVIFQGVLAFFNPTSAGASPAQYFEAQGVVALHGKVYGRVDFGLVSANVTLDAYTQAMVTFESCRPIVFAFSVSVSAQASVRIYYVRVSFHFQVQLDLSYTIGRSSQTPWVLASSATGNTNASGITPSRLSLARPDHAQRQSVLSDGMQASATSTTSTEDSATYVLDWQPATLVFESLQTAGLTMLPYITIGSVPVDWAGGDVAPANASPVYRLAFLLYADTGMAVDAATATDTAQRSAVLSTTESTTADLLVTALLRYALYSLPGGPSSIADPVNMAQLVLLAEQLALPETETAGFSISQLDTLFSTNLNFIIGGIPVDGTPAAPISAMLFPMPPGLSWTSAQAGNVDFSTYNQVGAAYEDEVQAILGQFDPVGSVSMPSEPDDSAPYESFASYVFRQYCLLLVKASVNAAQSQLRNVTTSLTPSMSLADVARSFATQSVPCVKENGDTVQNVAARIGATQSELLFLNPQIAATIDETDVGSAFDPAPLIGVSPEMLVQDNAQSLTLAPGAWPLGDLKAVVGQEGSTLAELAGQFNVTDIASLFAYEPVTDSGLYGLGENPNLLEEGTSFPLAAQTFVPTAGVSMTVEQVAAGFFVRYDAPDLTQSTLPGDPDIPQWYAQAIAILNQDTLSTPVLGVEATMELAPGLTLSVPTGYNLITSLTSYTTVAGDTLYRIGCALTLVQDYASLSAPPLLWTSFLAATTTDGTSFEIPAWPLTAGDTGIVIGSGETVEQLARRLIVDVTYNTDSGWTYDWDAVAVWIGPAPVLASLAVVVVPGATTPSTTSFTFQSLSNTYGLTLSDLALSFQNLTGLVTETTALTIQQIPVATVQDIENGLLNSTAFAGIVNQASRMLMSGLNLPGLQTVDGQVVPDPSVPLPLYDLTGQQFTLTVSDDPAEADTVALSLAVTSNVSWLQCGDTVTTTEGDDLTSLAAQYPSLPSLNPGVTADTTLPSGMVLFTETSTDGLTFNLTNQDILNEAPATGLIVTTVPATDEAPVALPLAGSVPRTYGFGQMLTLQTTQTLPIPTDPDASAPLAGNASLWPFPQSLLDLAATPSGSPYQIYAGSQSGATDAYARTVSSSTFGTQISLRARAIDDGAEHYQLLGVDTDQRSLLLVLRDAIASDPSGGASQGWLGLSPAPNASNPQGLALIDSSTSPYLIKTNVSTESAPEPDAVMLQATTEGQPVYMADLTTGLSDFLLLLWEGSVVGGTGYYLGFGDALPASAANAQGVVDLTLLVILGAQMTYQADGRALLPSNNCLLLAPGLNASVNHLYAEATDGSDMNTVALVPPGNAGFSLTITTPSGDGSQSDLQDRYSTLAVTCSDSTSGYAIPQAWTPALPVPDDGMNLSAQERQALAQQSSSEDDDTPQPYWKFQQVIPFYRFATTSPLPPTIGLPDPASDPYWGFGDATAYPTPELTFFFSDLLGNRSAAPSTGQGSLSLPVGYTDPLIGIANWPNISSFFDVTGAGSGDASLVMQIGLKTAALLPTSSQRGDAGLDAALSQMQKYAAVYYQLTQAGIAATLSTSLCTSPAEQAIDVAPLWCFAGGAYACAGTATRLQAATMPANTALATVLTTYPVRMAELAAANLTVPLNLLFQPTDATGTAQTPGIPFLMPFIAQRSLTDLYEQRPAGWPALDSPGDLFALPGNANLPLAVGVGLLLPQPTSIPTGDSSVTPSLAQLAVQYNTDIASLAEANKCLTLFSAENGDGSGAANVLTVQIAQADGSVLTLSVTVTAGVSDTLTGAQQQFAVQGGNLTVAEIAENNAAATGLLLPSLTLVNTTYLTQPGDTPSQNASSVSAADLGPANAKTVGIFDDGALVQFGVQAIALSGDTLQATAQRYGCPAEFFLESNSGLCCGTGLAVPGCFSWPDDVTTLRIPYGVRSGDILTTICASFASYSSQSGTAQYVDCVIANQYIVGTLVAGYTLTIKTIVGTVTLVTEENASFYSTLQQAIAINPETTINDLANAISDIPILQEGALLLFPPALLGATCAPQDLLTPYGIDGQSFALANIATPSLIVAGQTLTLTDASGNPVSVTTQTNDTFNSIIVRFAVSGLTTNAGEVALGNAEVPFLAGGALALLPPTVVRESIPLGSGGPYPATVFPLSASVTLTRPAALVQPDFATDGPVAIAISPLAAHAQDDGSASSSLTYTPFVTALTTALPTLRVGTAKVAGETTDLWCVDFSSTGIASVTIQPGVQFANQQAIPRFLALPPLYSSLVSRSGVEIAGLSSDGTLTTAVSTNFQSIDVEPWVLRFLGDFDRFLSGPYVTALYLQGESMQAVLNSVLASKQTLASSIAQGLQPVFDTTDATDPLYQQGLTTAVASLQQQLGISLLRAYDISVVAQYDVTANTSWSQSGTTATASLFGQAALVDSNAADDLAPDTVNFASAKTDLDSQSFLTLFATVGMDAGDRRYVQGLLTYSYSYTEFDEVTESVPGGYTDSQWLAFLPLQDKDSKPSALSETNPGNLIAPVPLRIYPSLPSIQQQTATAYEAISGALDDLASWDYAVTYNHEFAEQDTVRVHVDFNLGPAPTLMAEASPSDVFGPLAQYISVANSLWTLLDGLKAPDVSTASLNAATTFASLAEEIADSWSNPRESQSDDDGAAPEDNYVAGNSFGFDARVKYSDDGKTLSSVTLIRLQDEPGPEGNWPSLTAIPATGKPVALTPQEDTTQQELTYEAPEGVVPNQAQMSFRLAWDAISVSSYQNARSWMYVVRNDYLLQGADPSNDPGPATNPSFLLNTAVVTAPTLLTPLVERGVTQPISGPDLSTAVDTAVSTLFPGSDQVEGTTASWGLFYSFQVVADPALPGGGLFAKTPVVFYPNGSLEGVGSALQGAADAWMAAVQPADRVAGWSLDLVLYSNLTGNSQPLFRCELYYPLSQD